MQYLQMMPINTSLLYIKINWASENWASFSFPRGQPCVLVVVFFSNLLYFKLIWTLSHSKQVENKKISLRIKTELNHNICVLSLIIFSLYVVIKYIQKYRQYHEQWPIRTSQCFRKAKIQSRGASFVSFWQKVNKNENILEHDERWNLNNLSFITTLMGQLHG